MDLFTAEIAWFTPSKVYLQRTVDYLDKTGTPAGQQYERFGFLGFYHGHNYDEANSAVSLSTWQSMQHFQDFAQTEEYGDLVIPYMDAMLLSTMIMQVSFQDAQGFFDCVEAPFTEFVYITIRRGHDIDYHLRPLVLVLKQELEKVDAHVASCWGRSVDCADVVVGLIGWEDVHGSAHMSKLLSRIAEFSSIERKLARLKIALAHE
ncbi:hypothetical protein BDZ89DRAFT_329066 [Hymenopellis radicata]|nr:hypothetical protein BDZ89DRAFT_329066 [Hymenopellis radicata]